MDLTVAPVRAAFRQVALTLAVAVFAMLLIARQSSAADKLNVGILKIAGVANAWIAKQQGVFAKHGLDVTLVEFNSGADGVNTAYAGKVDVVLSIAGSAMTAIERGFDLVAVFQNEVCRDQPPDSGAIIVPVNSPIKGLADLSGKKVGVQSLNSQQVVGVNVVLKRAGVDLKKVAFAEMPFPALANALRAGYVDAISIVDPFTTQLVLSGVGRVISWSYVESIPNQPLGAWFAKRTFVLAHHTAIEAFNQAIKESIDYMNADEERTRQEVATFTGLPSDVVKSMPPPGLNYHVSLDNWQKTIDMMREYNVLQQEHTPDFFFAEEIKPYIDKK
jgi:NitT/TauT family transport system substrate-binding protein